MPGKRRYCPACGARLRQIKTLMIERHENVNRQADRHLKFPVCEASGKLYWQEAGMKHLEKCKDCAAALKLLNQHLTGREYTGLDDALFELDDERQYEK
jgi:uncharacterized protein with PIN domain